MNREVIIVGGMTGWGKSLWVKTYSAHAKRLLVYDPLHDPTFPHFGYPQVKYDSEEHGFDEFQEKSQPGTWDFLKDKKDTVTFRVGTAFPNRVEDLGIAAWNVGNNLLVIEEASTLFEKGQARLPRWLSDLIFVGRHRRCSLCFIAQRFMSIPKDVRSQASRIVTFNQHEEDDMSYLRSVFGKDDAARVSTLPKFTCLDHCETTTYEYSIADRAEKVLGIKLDRENHSEYRSFYQSVA